MKLQLVIPRFSPLEMIGPNYRVWRGLSEDAGLDGPKDQEVKEQSLTEVDFRVVEFHTALKSGEVEISGEEKLKRLKASAVFRLGAKTFVNLWQDYCRQGSESVLEWLHRERKIKYLDFFGYVLRRPDGERCHLYLTKSAEGRWRPDNRSLNLSCYSGFNTAVLPQRR
jgi:hypothetical protein